MMKLSKEQKEAFEEMSVLYPPDTRSALEIIEQEIKDDEQAHRAQDLFDKLVKESRHEEAEKVGKFLLYALGIDISAN